MSITAPYPSNPVLLRLINEGAFEHKGRVYELKNSSPANICEKYGQLILQKRLSTGLEIGTLVGFSTLFLAEALPIHNES